MEERTKNTNKSKGKIRTDGDKRNGGQKDVSVGRKMMSIVL